MTQPRVNRRRNQIADAAVYLLVRVVLGLVQSLSLSQLDTVASLAGWLFGDIFRIRHAVVVDNLLHAFPQMTSQARSDVRRRMWRHLFLLLFEMALAQRKLHRTNWRQHVHLEGARQMVSFLIASRPAVVVTAHLGNFELSGYLAGLFGFPTYTLARRLDNPYLDRFLRRFRERTGQTIVDSRGTAELAQTVLETGATLAILGDHHAGNKGCWVDFLGRPASCHKSVALFSLVNQIPLLVVVTTRQASLLHFVMKLVAVYDPQRDAADLRGVPELTQWFNRHLENEIRQHPDQYWWLHRRWRPASQAGSRVKPTRQASLTTVGG